jgi:predicted transposase YbfD/YdcC
MESNTEKGIIFDIGSLYAYFQRMHDPRKPKGLRYQLSTILVLLVMAKLCGEDRPSGIAEWVQNRAEILAEMLKLKRKGMPHHSTYRRILAEVVSVAELEQTVSHYLSRKKYYGRQVVLAIDGKVMRGTLDETQNGTYLLAAYLPSEGIVLMEVAMNGKGTEIPAAPNVLNGVDLRQKVVIGDAMHTQRGVSIQIEAGGGAYIWFAKGNQPQMEENIRLWFEPEPAPLPGMGHVPKDFETATQVSKGHGRIERRRITVSSQLKDFLNWPFLEQVFMLERRFISTKTGEVQEQVIYGFTSLSRDEVSPLKLLLMTRSYWGIENGLHYRRDVTLLEDRTRLTKGNAGHAMACINNLILGILLAKMKCRFIPSARRFLNAHPGEAFALISQL